MVQKSCVHQLRLVVYPIYKVLSPSKQWLGMGLLNHLPSINSGSVKYIEEARQRPKKNNGVGLFVPFIFGVHHKKRKLHWKIGPLKIDG